MPAFRYVSENPFRLLGIGSATPWKTVRRKARDAEKAVAVGLAQDTVPTGLRGDFGADALENIVSRVAALDSDPVERTIYRIFWSLEYDASKNAETNISNFAPRTNVESPEANGLSLYVCQGWFLEKWFWFIEGGFNSGWTTDLEHAFSNFSALYSEISFKYHFAQLLEKDGEEEDKAWRFAYEAHEQVALYILSTVAQRAAELWADPDTQSVTLSFINSVVNAPFDNDLIDKSLKTLGPVGDAEAARLTKAWHELEEWTPDSSETLQSSDNLRQLADIIGNRFAAAPLWRQVCDKHTERVGWTMRNYSVYCANEKDEYKEAARVLQMVRANKVMQSNAEIHERLEADWDALSDLIAGAALAEAEAKKETETKAAETKTRNQPASNTRVRYPVPAQEPSSRLASYMNNLIGVFWIALIIGIVVLAFLPRNRTNSTAQTEPKPTSTSTASDYAIEQPSPETSQNSSEDISSRTTRLRSEWQSLKSTNLNATAQLDKDEQNLKNESESLDQQGKIVDRDRATVDRFDQKAIVQFNKKVNALNKRVNDYKARRNEFNRSVADYNKRVTRLEEIRAALEETGN